MPTAKQLWLGFGMLLGLLIATTLVVASRLAALQVDLDRIATTKESASDAATEMKVHVNALGLTILILLVGGVIVGTVIARLAIRAVLKSESRLQTALIHAESVVDTVREPLVILNENLTVHSANRPFHDLFQVTAGEIEGRLIFELGQGHWDIPRLREVLEQLLPQDQQFQDFEVEQDFDRIGHRTMLLNGRRLYRQNDETKLILLSIEDISFRKQFECEREMLLANERAGRNERERLNLIKYEFLATVSHELRTPLQAILGWSQLLQSGKLVGDAAAKAADAISASARTQSQLIEDLLDVSRIVSGKIVLDTRTVQIDKVIKQAIQTVQPAAAAKEVTLRQSLDQRCRPMIGDANRLQQVIWNLLSNAIKFTPKGGQVQIALAQVNSMIQITVSDTGQGMKPEFLPHVFERFRQADASTTRLYGGLGLGLAIVRYLVELHGGQVQADSPGEGRGATFTVILPQSAACSDLSKDSRKPDDNSGFTRSEVEKFINTQLVSISGLKIVVVDDDPSAREVIGRILEEAHAKVATACSVEEALDLIERFQPDVLVSDIGLPGQDGYDLIRQVRAWPADRGGNIPAIALTALTRPEDRARALAAGYQSHVGKPVEPRKLTEIVAALARSDAKEGIPV
ncbi:MAG: response regulator [Planctomycetaceae bacterium]|nr:response regulator [Planctomycetaceae bacterium]